MRWAWAEVDLGAVAHNVRVVASMAAPAQVWAVVKADAYGHGAVPVARTALDAGAEGLCVGLVQEGAELRQAGIEAPILLLSEQPAEELDQLVGLDLMPTVYTVRAVDELVDAVDRCGRQSPLGVHLKIDTGMHRVGAQPAEALALAGAIASHPQLTLDGVFTHLAVADEPGAASNARQLEIFMETLGSLTSVGHRPRVLHAANSAAAIAIADARLDLVRVGIAIYGIAPGEGVRDLCADVRPVLTLRARVGLVKRVVAGEGVSYGLRYVFMNDTTVATVPIGYGDGVPRRLSATGGEVLVHGKRRPIVGVVTMDQLMIDCGDSDVAVGDEVVLIGRQRGAAGDDEIRAEEWASRLGTIGYEIVCGISKRIERRHVVASHPASWE